MLKSLIKDLFDIIFIEKCITCNTFLNKFEKNLCLHCLYNITSINRNFLSHDLNKKFYGKIPIKNIYSFCIYLTNSKVQKLIYNLKYQNNPYLGFFLGNLFGSLLLSNLKTKYDYIIPVPLHEKKLKIRGYNQAEYFARGLGKVLEIPCLTDILIRIKATDSQTKKVSKLLRWENIKNAFSIDDGKTIQNKNIFLVDDVITTGATIESCSHELIKFNPSSINIITIAYA